MRDSERLERILQRLPQPHCPKCGALVTPAHVVADGNTPAEFYVVSPKVWIVCNVQQCAHRLCTGDPQAFIRSEDDVLLAFEEKFHLQ